MRETGAGSTLEQALRAAVAQGKPFDCGGHASSGSTPEDLDAVEDWDERIVPAQVLVDLCTREGVCDPRVGVQLSGACVTELVDLSGIRLDVPLELSVCRLGQGVLLNEAHVHSLRLVQCDIPTLEADELASDHSLHLIGSRLGDLVLSDARITGGIYLTGATLANDNDEAFTGDGMVVTGGAFFDKATVTGELRLPGAHIGGQLSLTGATLSSENGSAFMGDGMVVTRDARFDKATVTGGMWLSGAHIGGQLILNGATLSSENGTAFNGDGMVVTRDAFFRRATVTGGLRLPGTHIGGQLILTGATLSSENGSAFAGDGMAVTGHAHFDKTTVTGELRLPGTRIDGDLSLEDATLSNENGEAFTADRMSVTRGAFFRRATVTGELRLPGTHIGGQLSLEDASLTNVTEGESPNGEGQRVGIALHCQDLRADSLILTTRSPIKGHVNLNSANVRNLDDQLESWPTPPGHMVLDAFSYETLVGSDRDVASRLAWVRRNREFSPGVYNQLSDMYRRAGHDSDARTVGIAREDQRRRDGQLGTASRVWNGFLGLTVAHGYKPWRAAWYLLGTLVVSTVLFILPAGERALAPTEAVNPTPTADHCTDEYECFEPWVYPLDVVLPVVDLHQESNWLPTPDRPWGSWYRALTWSLIAIGWVLTTAVVAAIGTIWRR